MKTYKSFSISHEAKAAECYVAFVDILGLERKVRDNVEEVLDIYEEIRAGVGILRDVSKDIRIQCYVDSCILSSEKLESLVEIIQRLYMITLERNCLIKGGIGHGKPVDGCQKNNSYVVNQALVQAMEVEKKIQYPCVALHDSIEVPRPFLNASIHPVIRGLMYLEGTLFVSPFNIACGQSAITQIQVIYKEYPEYRDKCDWLLRLYEVVVSGNPLVP